IYLQSPFSNVKQMSVLGNDVITDEQIIKYSDVTVDMNMWRINVKDIEKKIAEHPLVNEVNVARKFPQTLQFTIVENNIIGYVKENNELHPIVSDGVVVSNADVLLPRGAPLFENFTDE